MTSWRLTWSGTSQGVSVRLSHGICLRWQLPLLLALVAGNLGMALADSLIPLAAASLHEACGSCVLQPGTFLLRASSPRSSSRAAPHTMMAILVISCVVAARSQRWRVAGISLYMASQRWWLPAQIDSIRKTLYESPKQDDER
jgi:hypothetical protein